VDWPPGLRIVDQRLVENRLAYGPRRVRISRAAWAGSILICAVEVGDRKVVLPLFDVRQAPTAKISG